jgi:hypothetical protein
VKRLRTFLSVSPASVFSPSVMRIMPRMKSPIPPIMVVTIVIYIKYGLIISVPARIDAPERLI